jgi:DNA-binding transcriptional LysR family regulator
MQDLNDMLYFAEVVDQGGFAAASRALGVPKSKLSRRVAELEARVGVRLLHRTTRKLSLTPAGELYHRHCAAVRDEAQAAAEAMAQVQHAPRGTIRVVVPVTLAQSSVGRVVAEFAALYPEVRIDMQVSNRVVDLVEEGVDVALRVRQTLEESGSLVVKIIGRTDGVLICSPNQIQRQGQPQSWDDLQRMDTLAMSALDGRASWRLVSPDGEERQLVHRPRFVADDLLTLKTAALQGVGMMVLPAYMCCESLVNGRLVEVLPGWRPPPGILHAVFPSRRGMVPAVRALLDFLEEHVKSEELVFGTAH